MMTEVITEEIEEEVEVKYLTFGRGSEQLTLSYTNLAPVVPTEHGSGWVEMTTKKPSTGEHEALDNGTWNDITDHVAIAAITERAWRNEQLIFVDNELNKTLDGHGTYAESSCRAYRNILRDYPVSDNFPHGTRPSFESVESEM